MKSTEFLQAAIDVQAERGKQYDKPSGERSMAATVSAFNCITGSMLEESDGWMFLGILKLVRQSQNPEQYHHDSALDFVAYASLYAEAASEQCGQLEAKQESELDIQSGVWVDAPAEATHYTAADEDNYAAFWREEGGVFTDCWTSGNHYTGARYKPEPHLLQSRPTSTAQ
jgi:hypothetical protein